MGKTQRSTRSNFLNILQKVLVQTVLKNFMPRFMLPFVQILKVFQKKKPTRDKLPNSSKPQNFHVQQNGITFSTRFFPFEGRLRLKLPSSVEMDLQLFCLLLTLISWDFKDIMNEFSKK